MPSKATAQEAWNRAITRLLMITSTDCYCFIRVIPCTVFKGRGQQHLRFLRNLTGSLQQAVKLQYSADSLTRLAQGVRREMETAAPEKQEVLQSVAEEFEREAAAKQAKADMAFMAAEQNGNPVPEVSSGSPQQEQGQAYSQFVVLSSPAYSDTNPIPFDIKLPPGLVYTIQLAAFKNPVQPSLFKGLFPLYGKKKPDNGVSYYYTGIFRMNEDARQALSKVRAEGFSDAFVIAMMDDAQVSMERAAMLEKEWAAKPLPVSEPEVQGRKIYRQPTRCLSGH